MSLRRLAALGVMSLLMVLVAWLAFRAPEPAIRARVYEKPPTPNPTSVPQAAVTPLFPDVYRVGGDVLPPRLAKKVEPVFPPALHGKTVQGGMVIVEAIIMEDGTVGHPRILQSYAPDVDSAVLRAVQEWQYKPATRQGRPVRVYLTISAMVHAR